jgi:hypothetical protein
MTLLIAHRGNYDGPVPEKENHLIHLEKAIEQSFDVEIDVWNMNGQWFFGHLEPSVAVTLTDINRLSPHAWYHAKNYGALYLLNKQGHHTFAHRDDPFVVTNRGWIWSHRGQPNPGGIVVMPLLASEQQLIRSAAGVCHDQLLEVRDLIQSALPIS